MNGYPQGLLGALGLNEEDLRRQSMTSGLLNAGLQMLAASGPSPVRQSLGQIIAQGGAAGLQGMQQAQESAIDRALRNMQVQAFLTKQQQDKAALERQEQIRQMVMKNPDLQTAIPSVLQQTGDVSSAAQLAQVAKAIEPETRVMKPGDVLIRGQEIIFQIEPEQKEKDYIRQDLGNNIAFIDPKTLQTVKIIPKDKDLKDMSSGEDAVRKEFLGQAKPYIEISQAYRKIEEATKVPSAAGDVSLVFAFMKILDPGSVVREGEFATAANAAGIPDRVRAQYNAAMRGERLAPAQRADFLNQAKNLARSQKDMFENQVLPQYQYISNQRGYDVNKVISNPFSGLDLSGRPVGNQEQQRKPLGSIFGGK